MRTLAALATDSAKLAEIARAPLAELAQKLPGELIDADSALQLTTPAALAGVLEQARELLLAAVAEDVRP
ncbi:MAG: hypothetical protein IT304_13525 [Dehalococcoidia bacterium]|nr:hypothetical protein [Dehalococcoidia bacterium]